MKPPSPSKALKRNLLLSFLAISGAALFASQYWSLPLDLTLLGVAAAGLLVYLAVRFPEWFLVAALFAPQWKTVWIFQSIRHVADLTVVMLLCLAGGLAWRLIWSGRFGYREMRALFSGQLNPLLAFGVFAALLTASYFYTSAPDYGGTKLVRFLLIGTLLLIAPLFIIFSEDDFRRFASLFVGFSAVTAIQLISTLEMRSQDAENDITRIGAGWLMGMAILLLLFYPLSRNTRWRRALVVVLLPLFIAGLMASAARGPIVALTICSLIGVAVLLKEGQLRIVTAGVLLLFLVVGLGGSYFLLRQTDAGKFTAKAGELEVLFTQGDSTGSAGKRLAFYRATLDAIPNQPLLGTGIGSWSTFYYGNDQRNYPHNLLLEITFEEGVVGAAAFLVLMALVGVSIVRMIRSSRSHFLVVGLLVVYLRDRQFIQRRPRRQSRVVVVDRGRVECLPPGAVPHERISGDAGENATNRSRNARSSNRSSILPPVRAGPILSFEKGPCVARKVCVLTSAHPTFDVRIFHKECKSLARAGYDVTLVAPSTTDGIYDGIALKGVPVWNNRLDRFTRGSVAVYRRALEAGADIYHFHDPELIPAALLLRLQGKKVIYDIHEDLPRTISYKPYIPQPLSGLVSRTVEFVEEWAGKRFSALVTATPGIGDRFRRVNENLAVLNNYPKIEEMEPPASSPKENHNVSLLYVGMRITRARGAEEMVRAIGLLPEDLNVQLKLVGGWGTPELPASLSKIPGWNRVEYVGPVGRKEVAAQLQ